MISKKEYPKCITEATKRFNSGKIKTCPRGYCTAKAKYQVYPSAYANGYASSVCKGVKPDINNITEENDAYMKRINKLNTGEISQKSNMGRWFKENWVNVCKPKNNGEYQPCGRSKANLKADNYPYCRPEIRIDNNTPMTVGEITDAYGVSELKKLCSQKRSKKQGVSGSPVYLRSEKTRRNRGKITLNIDKLQLAINGKSAAEGGLNLPEFRSSVILWIEQNLSEKQIIRLFHYKGTKKQFLQNFVKEIINDNRKQLISLSDLLGINNMSPTRSSKIDNNNNMSPKRSSKIDNNNNMSDNNSKIPDMKLVNKYNPLKKCSRGNLYSPRLSTKGKKKLEIDVLDKDNNQSTVYFGHRDYQDFTTHRDSNRQNSYCKRSAGIKCTKSPNGICDQTSPNFWSRHMLWNCNDNDKKDICNSITDKQCKKKLKC
jgi:hypothetical protein